MGDLVLKSGIAFQSRVGIPSAATALSEPEKNDSRPSLRELVNNKLEERQALSDFERWQVQQAEELEAANRPSVKSSDVETLALPDIKDKGFKSSNTRARGFRGTAEVQQLSNRNVGPETGTITPETVRGSSPSSGQTSKAALNVVQQIRSAEVNEEKHPTVTYNLRAAAALFGTNESLLVDFLKRQGYKVAKDEQGELAIKVGTEKSWYRFDPKVFRLNDVMNDVVADNFRLVAELPGALLAGAVTGAMTAATTAAAAASGGAALAATPAVVMKSMLTSSFLTGANDMVIQVAGVGCKYVGEYDSSQLAMSFIFGGLCGGIPYAKGIGQMVLSKLEGTVAGKMLKSLITDLTHVLDKAIAPLRELKDKVFSSEGMVCLKRVFSSVQECFSNLGARIGQVFNDLKEKMRDLFDPNNLVPHGSLPEPVMVGGGRLPAPKERKPENFFRREGEEITGALPIKVRPIQPTFKGNNGKAGIMELEHEAGYLTKGLIQRNEFESVTALREWVAELAASNKTFAGFAENVKKHIRLADPKSTLDTTGGDIILSDELSAALKSEFGIKIQKIQMKSSKTGAVSHLQDALHAAANGNSDGFIPVVYGNLADSSINVVQSLLRLDRFGILNTSNPILEQPILHASLLARTGIEIVKKTRVSQYTESFEAPFERIFQAACRTSWTGTREDCHLRITGMLSEMVRTGSLQIEGREQNPLYKPLLEAMKPILQRLQQKPS